MLQYDIVCFSHLRWDFVFQRPQHLMTRFAKERRVFYVEEPQFVESGAARLSVSPRQDGLIVVTPEIPKGTSARDVVEKQKELVSELLKTEGIRSFVSWYYSPMALPISELLRPLAVVYDCMDELSLFKFAPPELTSLEARLLKKADVVFTGGRSLFEAKRHLHDNIHAFPSSIEREHFAQARDYQAEPEDQRDIPHPRLGFYGVIDERMDLELLRGIADARPDWQLVMIGPVVKIEESVLPRGKNLHYLGPKTYQELPQYLAGWDIALLPFAINDSTKFISPTKTPEYLSAGKFVVSTPIRDVVSPYGERDLVAIGKNAEEFVRACESYLAARDAAHWREKVDAFLSTMSWDETFSRMNEKIREAIGQRPKIEIWGGVECTLNRVGETYFDQCRMSGHDARGSDLELFASLGIKALRFPLLWEKTAPETPGQYDWRASEERLGLVKELGIRPILTLLHHGSGPKYTDLLDPEFPDLLAQYARAVAEKYPWVSDYTPVNEPLTTARFSALYGIWYPHQKDVKSFLRALFHECKGAAMAMAAIREVNPEARFINTEDLGITTSTPLLRYQADHENERRWLSMDLLMGRVEESHPWWHEFIRAGIPEHELEWFLTTAIRPDILGINHYITSNRYLDENPENYPECYRGGNERHRYADVETVRVRGQDYLTVRSLLKEAWDRYRRPLAVTEAHIDAGREDQLRWIDEFWRSCRELKESGVDIQALTVWSLLGAYDWNSLVTKPRGYYESGAFDLRSGVPRATALVPQIQALAKRGEYQHPILDAEGWWHQPAHKLYPPVAKDPDDREIVFRRRKSSRPIVITGANGTLGRAFARICAQRGLAFVALSRSDMDICNEDSVNEVLGALQPWAVINAAGYVKVDEAERERERCERENVVGARNLARFCSGREALFLTYSSDLVFDGNSTSPYLEESPKAPLNVYGHSKAQAEQEVRNVYPDALVIRTSSFFGPWDGANFVTRALNDLRMGRVIAAAEDIIMSPTYVPELVWWSLNLLIDRERGVWHLANQGQLSWAELARRAAKLARLDTSRIEALPHRELRWEAPRPSFSALGSTRGFYLSPLAEALEKYTESVRRTGLLAA